MDHPDSRTAPPRSSPGDAGGQAPTMTRRSFMYRAALCGGAGLAACGLVPMLSVLELAHAGEPAAFRFAWISDTHLYPRGVNARFAERAAAAFRDVQAMDPPPDFLVVGGDLAHMGDASELELGAQLLGEARLRTLFIPGEHDWYLDMGARWNRMFGASPWSFDHKGVRFVGLDTVSHAADFWTPRRMTAQQRMCCMAALEDPRAGAWAGLGHAQLAWLDTVLAGWPRQAPVVLFSHNPLYEHYAPWNFSVRDWREVHEILRPFSRVTSIHGHCHQPMERWLGGLRSIGMPATAWPWPVSPGRDGYGGAPHREALADVGWSEVVVADGGIDPAYRLRHRHA